MIKVNGFADNAATVDKGKQPAIPIVMIQDGRKEDFGGAASIYFHAQDAAAVCAAIIRAAMAAQAGMDTSESFHATSAEIEED